MAYPAADSHLAHHLEHGLVDDSLAQLGAQAHGHLTVPAVTGGGREDLHERPTRSSAPASLFGAPARTVSSHAWGRALSTCHRIGPERLGTALAAEFASPLEGLHRHNPERLHASCQPMPPSYASGLLPVQGRQHPTTEQALNVETLSRGVARNRVHLNRQLEALPRKKSSIAPHLA